MSNLSATNGFIFNHTMLRVRDPEVSLMFYQDILGMTVIYTRRHPEAEFDLYFLAKLTDEEIENLPKTESERAMYAFSRPGVLELTHNYGTEADDEFFYHDGNTDPQGFGHICFSVSNLQEAVAWFDQHEVNFKKRPEDGMIKNIAFIKDPDGYWIEIVQPDLIA